VSIHHVGSGGHDRMVGGPESNTMRGLGGNDTIGGAGGDDRLFGGAGDDRLSGGTGDDRLSGGPGPDALDGGPGSDTMIDTSGPTVVRTGTSTGGGRDDVDVRDGRGDDTVTCDTRRTRVVADPGDQILGHCGSVIRRGPAT
jgi:Ca2+-binding RTX toxin-like protein